MKKFYLLTKTLLVAALLMVGANAWGQYSLTDNGDGTWTETYDFQTPSKSFTGNIYCYSNGTVNITNTNSVIMAHDKIEMNDRYAAQNGSSDWMIQRNNGLYNGGGGGRKFAILKLHAGDVVTVTKDGVKIQFSSTPNAYKTSDGDVSANDELESDVAYTIKADGQLNFSSTRYGHIYKVTIVTSKPVLEKPSFSFVNMAATAGLYYPSITVSSGDDGITYNATFDDAAADVTSGYTFTATGTLSVYTSKAGRTNSANAKYTVSNGWIKANSVAVGDLVGTVNYGTGDVLADNTVIGGTWVVPGLDFSGTNITYRTWGIMPTSGNRTFYCNVLNENRIATYKKYYYEDYTKYEYLTASSNSIVFRRSGDNKDRLQEYNLYVNPSEKVSVTIGSTGYSTFSSPVPLNFAGIDGLTVYVATTVADGAVTLSPVTTAPANTGLVLKGTAGADYDIPVTNSAATPASNLFVGCIVETTVAKDATSKFNNYVLVNEGGTAKFQSLVDNGATIPAGKAFLKNGASGDSSARELRIVFDDDILTGINEAKSEVEFAKEGKFVVDGKLVIFKKGMKFYANGQVVK